MSDRGSHPAGACASAPRRRKRIRRIVFLTMVLPPVVVTSFCLLLAYQIWASNRQMDVRLHLPIEPPPTHASSLLVFAPHCDDETLGAGGLILHARQEGSSVRVVFLTNGDGFRISAAKALDKISVKPADFVAFGYDRQEEARAALGVLDVPRSDIVFLGYPDRGLLPMLTDNWSPASLYRSYYTHDDHSPYTDAPTPNAPYCGESVVRDVERQMEIARPTDIYVTHPNDDHPDHAAAGAFVKTALDQLRERGEPWALHARLHYYLVHHGDWPVPQGLHEHAPLSPPAGMTATDTAWSVFPLSAHDVQRKYAAIKRYKSQTAITGRFLYAFVRTNEIFGRIDGRVARELPVVPDGTLRLDGNAATWGSIPPVLIDPVADTVLRDVQGGGDIERIYAARDRRNLYVRVDLRKRVSSDIRYALVVRTIAGTGAQPDPIRFSGPPPADGQLVFLKEPVGAEMVRRGSVLEYRIPCVSVGLTPDRPGEICLLADTRFGRMPIDRSALRGVALKGAPLPVAAAPLEMPLSEMRAARQKTIAPASSSSDRSPATSPTGARHSVPTQT